MSDIFVRVVGGRLHGAWGSVCARSVAVGPPVGFGWAGPDAGRGLRQRRIHRVRGKSGKQRRRLLVLLGRTGRHAVNDASIRI